MEEQVARFVAGEPKPQLPPPMREGGWYGTVRKNLFATVGDSVLTVVLGIFAFWIFWNILDWALFSAVFTGSDREACLVVEGGEEVGACWAFVRAKFAQFMYGLYPLAERWRVDLTAVMLVALLVPFLIPQAPHKRLNGLLLVLVFPFVALVLLTGGNFRIEGGWLAFLFAFAAIFSAIAAAARVGAPENLIRIANLLGALAFVFVFASMAVSSGSFYVLEFEFSLLTFVAWLVAIASIAVSVYAARISGPAGQKGSVTGAIIPPIFVIGLILLLDLDFGLQSVPTNLWGGLMLTLVVALSGIGASLPLGILLALGRRSDMPAIRLISVIFIEFWRGVPLITVLFMSAFMIPLFLPDGVSFNQLLRALIGVALFSTAYMAEVIRGGLQALPSGQYEGARALGLGYWQMMRLIIMPQAIKLVIPGIVNTFIGLFKDTSLVYIIGLADLLGTVRRGFSDPSWITPTTPATGLVFAAFLYWLFCFGMSRYSIFVENRLNRGYER